MKFAKYGAPPAEKRGTARTNQSREIERDLVPEWRLKYLDYKVRVQPIHAVSLFVGCADCETYSLGKRNSRPLTAPFAA